MEHWGAWYLMGDNLKAVCAQFSTVSLTVLLRRDLGALHTLQPLLEMKTQPWFLPFNQSLSVLGQLKILSHGQTSPNKT